MAIDPDEFDIPVQDYDFSKATQTTSLIDQMAQAGGFTATKLSTARDILLDMIEVHPRNLLVSARIRRYHAGAVLLWCVHVQLLCQQPGKFLVRRHVVYGRAFASEHSCDRRVIRRVQLERCV